MQKHKTMVFYNSTHPHRISPVRSANVYALTHAHCEIPMNQYHNRNDKNLFSFGLFSMPRALDKWDIETNQAGRGHGCMNKTSKVNNRSGVFVSKDKNNDVLEVRAFYVVNSWRFRTIRRILLLFHLYFCRTIV